MDDINKGSHIMDKPRRGLYPTMDDHELRKMLEKVQQG